MMIKRVGLFAVLAAVAVMSVGCNEPAKPPAANVANTNAPAPTADSVKVQPKVLKDEPGPDGSRIVVRQLESGDQVSVRKWDAGPVKKVTVRAKAGETKGIRVVFRDGKIVRVVDKEAVAHALDWTGAQLADVARKTGTTLDAPADTSDDDEVTNAKPK